MQTQLMADLKERNRAVSVERGMVFMKRISLSNAVLKNIAYLTMLIDHFLPSYLRRS